MQTNNSVILPEEKSEEGSFFDQATDNSQTPFFGKIYEVEGGDEIDRGRPLYALPERRSFLFEKEILLARTEHGRNTEREERVLAVMRLHGWYRSGDGGQIIRIQDGRKAECVDRKNFHYTLTDFAAICSCMPRRRMEQVLEDGRVVKVCIPVEKERDAAFVEGYTETHKYVAANMVSSLKNQIAAKIFAHLDVLEGVEEQALVSENLETVLPGGEWSGYCPVRKVWIRALEGVGAQAKIWEGASVEEFRKGCLDMMELLFGYIPQFAPGSAQFNGLLFFVMATLFRKNLGACPFFWVSTPSKDGQGLGKTHLGKQLQVLAGQESGSSMLTLGTDSGFDVSQFARDWNRALACKDTTVILIDNFVATPAKEGSREAAQLGNIALMASFGTHEGKTMRVNLTGKSYAEEVSPRRIVSLNGNGIVPEGDWIRRSLYFCLDTSNAFRRGKGVRLSETGKLDQIRGFLLAAWQAWIQRPDGRACVANDEMYWAPAYSSYNETFNILVPFVEWLSGEKDASFLEGGGLVSVGPVLTRSVLEHAYWCYLFSKAWVRAFGGRTVLAREVVEHEEIQVLLGRYSKKFQNAKVSSRGMGIFLSGLSEKLNLRCTGCKNFRYYQSLGILPRPVVSEDIRYAVEHGTLPVGTEDVRNEIMAEQVTHKAVITQEICQRHSMVAWLRSEGVEIRPSGGEWKALCPLPGHTEKTPSFTIFGGTNGRERFKCFGCGKAGDIIRLVTEMKGVEFLEAVRILESGSPGGGILPVARRKLEGNRADVEDPAVVEERRRLERARRMWEEGQDSILCMDYIQGRLGQSRMFWQDMMEFWRNIRFLKSPAGPCMMAQVRTWSPGGGLEFSGVHLTVLDNTMKENLKDGQGKNIRKLMGPVGGGMVSLWGHPLSTVLVVGEGIETTLAWFLMFGRPVREDPGLRTMHVAAALSAGNMGRISLPPHVTRLVVLVDGDEAGEKALEAIQERLQGKPVMVVAERAPSGKDFNDLLAETDFLRQK